MRSLSTSAIESIFGSSTGEAWIYLITIEHEDLPTTRICRNTESIDSRGNTFTAGWFDITIPAQSEGELPRVDFVMDNIGLELMEGIRSLTGQPTVTLEEIMESEPDTVQTGPYVFSLKDVQYNKFMIKGQISYESLLTEPYNWRKFTPLEWPGMFTTIR